MIRKRLRPDPPHPHDLECDGAIALLLLRHHHR